MGFIASAISAAATFIGFGATAATLIGQVGTLAIGIGAQLWLGSKNKSKSKSVSGSETTTQIGGDLPRQILFGKVATAGQLVYVNSYGKSNAHEEEVYSLCDVECDSLVSIIVDGKAKALISQSTLYEEDARYFVEDYGSALDIRFYRGAASQTADAGLVAHSNPAGRWTSAHRGDGVCYVVVDKTYNEDLFSGFPTFTFIVKGAKVYDARKDSTEGGSGSHRYADPTTWEWSENNALCLYTYQRGFFRSGKLFMGQGVPASDLPIDYYVSAANVCDESVTLLSGSEARYAVSAIASDDQTHATIIESFVSGMAGELYEQGGIFLPYAGAARSVVATITDGDLILAGQKRFSRKLTRDKLVNYLSGAFTSPDDLWESKGTNPIQSSANEAADGERLGASSALPQITSQTRAERVMLIRYNEGRHQAAATLPLSLRHLALEIGDWITWASARHGTRTYRIDGWVLTLHGERQLGVSIQVREVSTAIYGWTAATDQQPTVPVGSGRTDTTLTRTVAGFDLNPGSDTSPSGESIPTIVATWTPPEDATVTSVIVQYGIEASGEYNSQAVSNEPESGRLVIRGIAGGQNYQARATVTTDPPRSTTWTGWVTITTSGTTIPVEAEIPASLTLQLGSLSDQSELLRHEALASLLASQASNVNRSLQIREAEAKAVAIGEAAASAVSSLAADVAENYATILQVDELAASVGDIVGNVGVSFVAAADQTGSLARYEAKVSATDGSGEIARGALTLEAVSSGGTAEARMKIRADRTTFIGASGDTATMTVTADGAFVSNLQVDGTLIIGSTAAGGFGGSILLVDGT